MNNPFIGLGHRWSDGSSGKKDWGYHDLPFPEYADAPTHRRGTAQRAKHISYLKDLKGLSGLDIGCSVGGISFSLQLGGSQMLGLDLDEEAVRVANEVEAIHNTGARFLHMKVPSEDFIKVLDEGNFDFVVWLSNFMWIAKQMGYENSLAVVDFIAARSPVLFFETAQSQKDGGAGRYCPFNGPGDVANMLKQFYTKVENTGIPVRGWGNRSLFLCER